jgi:hypothetical protein
VSGWANHYHLAYLDFIMERATRLSSFSAFYLLILALTRGRGIHEATAQPLPAPTDLQSPVTFNISPLNSPREPREMKYFHNTLPKSDRLSRVVMLQMGFTIDYHCTPFGSFSVGSDGE